MLKKKIAEVIKVTFHTEMTPKIILYYLIKAHQLVGFFFYTGNTILTQAPPSFSIPPRHLSGRTTIQLMISLMKYLFYY